MFGLGVGELVIVTLVFVLLFGSKKIPDLAQGIGDAVRNVRDVFSHDSHDSHDETEDRQK